MPASKHKQLAPVISVARHGQAGHTSYLLFLKMHIGRIKAELCTILHPSLSLPAFQLHLGHWPQDSNAIYKCTILYAHMWE